MGTYPLNQPIDEQDDDSHRNDSINRPVASSDTKDREERVKIPRRRGRPPAQRPISRALSMELKEVKTLTTDQVAELFHVKPRTIRDRWKKSRNFPQPTKFGRNLLFRETEIIDYMSRQERLRRYL